MLDINYIRKHQDELKQNIINRQLDAKKVNVDELLQVASDKKSLIQKVEALRQKRKEIADQINKAKEAEKQELIPEFLGSVKKNVDNSGNTQLHFGKSEVVEYIKTAKSIRKELKKEEERSDKILLRWRELMDLMPNITHSKMPVGKDDSGNVEIKSWGGKPKHKFNAKHHLDLGESLGLIDVKKSALVSGSRFYYLLNEAVSLEFALFSHVFQKLVSKGFTPIETPVLVKEKALYGTGYFPFENDQVYKIEKHNLEDKNELYLTGTSEQAIVSYHLNDLLKGKMPKKYIGYSPCFRSEVGSWGKDVRGIKRVHQFNKLEMIYFTTPESSQQYMDEALAIEEEILQELELPYHVLEMCTGDVGMATYRKFDVEVWLPSQQEYCETMSNSDLASYHARRLNIKYLKEDGTREFVHTVSATAVTNTRIILAILDNFQQKDGSVRVPKVLQKYIGEEVIKR